MTSLAEQADPIWSLTGAFNERNAELSPDGQWMAYQSDETGEYQVYVRPFPEVDDGLVPISNRGGIKPLWSRGGRELFYVQPGSSPQLISVSIESRDSSLMVSGRETVMDWPYLRPTEGRDYDISPDGQQFLALIQVGNLDRDTAPPQINVVLNWFQELTERVPVP